MVWVERCETGACHGQRCGSRHGPGVGSPLTRFGRKQRAAFSLVELLVAIAIIGILIGLLLPAVQAARETARRTECANHLKQIGLAFQEHHSTHGFFPSGGWDWNDPPTYQGRKPVVGEEQKAGWGFQILPFIEARNIWEAGPKIAIGTALPLFFCPSRRAPQTVVIDHDNYEPRVSGTQLTHALCDYAASNRELTGVVRRYKPLSLRHIFDGTSFTLLAGDKRLNLRFLGQPQDDDNEGYTAGWNSDTIRRTNHLPRPDFNGTGDGDHRFGSSHPTIFNAVMVDGSVRPVTYKVELKIFRNLGNINDGYQLDSNDL